MIYRNVFIFFCTKTCIYPPMILAPSITWLYLANMFWSDLDKHKCNGDELIFRIFLPLKASFNSNILSINVYFFLFVIDLCNMNVKGKGGEEKKMEGKGEEEKGREEESKRWRKTCEEGIN